MRLQISNGYSNNFIFKYFKNILKNLLLEESKKSDYKNINNYLNKNYNISLKRLCELVSANLHISEYNNYYLIYIDNNVKYNELTLDSLVRLVDDGNRSVKGTNFFKNKFKYLQSHIRTLYLYYETTKESILWQ